MDKQQEAFKTWREQYCSMPLYNEAMAWAAWQAATAAERERCAKVCDALVYAIDNGGNQYRREANAIQCAAVIRASNL
jgi:hypothetical protein